MLSLFCCPVCGGALDREERRYACPAGHGFDLAKEGYVNLLPANRMHSKTPGDDKEMAAARTRFLDGGWYRPLRDMLCQLVDRYGGEAPALLDAGCGEGYCTAALAETVRARDGRAAGIDLSKPSVKKAAKRCGGAEFAVASVYHLPVADRAVDLLELLLATGGGGIRPGAPPRRALSLRGARPPASVGAEGDAL